MPQNNGSSFNLRVVPESPRRRSAGSVASAENVCPTCFGTGMEVIPDKGARICVCRKRDDHLDQLAKAQLPRRYSECHFDSYKPQNASQVAAKKLAFNFSMEYPAVDSGLLIIGTVGVGKTHLAVSILKSLSERGFSCLFYEFGALLKEIQDSYNPNTFSSELNVLAPVLNAEILVLDELGASKPTDWVRDTMAHIINNRYNERKFTIFTTNYLDERQDPREETLEDRIGIRARSRIYEMCQTVIVHGDDHRRKLHKSSQLPKQKQ